RAEPFAGRHLRKVMELLRLRTEAHDADAADTGVYTDETGQAPRTAAEHFVHQGLLQYRKTQAAVLRRNAQSEQSELACAFEEILRQLVGAVNLLPTGIGLVLDEVADRLLQQHIISRESEVHRLSNKIYTTYRTYGQSFSRCEAQKNRLSRLVARAAGAE